MSDTSVTTETPTPTPTPPPLPNDQAARSPTGEILEPSQIQAKPTTPPANPDGTPAPTSTPDPTKPEVKPTTPTTGAPETYTDFTAPEGYTLDPKVIEAATPIFKELGLSQEAAQKLVEFHSKQMIEASKAPASTYESLRTDWRAKVDADADLKAAVSGGKTGLEAVKLDIGRAFNALGDPTLVAEFKDAMNLTGVGDHPAFIKAMWKLSSFITEGKHVAGGGPSPHGQRAPGTTDKPSPAAALYPNLPH